MKIVLWDKTYQLIINGRGSISKYRQLFCCNYRNSTNHIYISPLKITIYWSRLQPWNNIYISIHMGKGGELIWQVPEGLLSEEYQWEILLLTKITPSTKCRDIGKGTDGYILIRQHNTDIQEALKVYTEGEKNTDSGTWLDQWLLFFLLFIKWELSCFWKIHTIRTPKEHDQSARHAIICNFIGSRQ